MANRIRLAQQMTEAKWMRTPFAVVRQSVHSRRAKSGNSHSAYSADDRGEMEADTICDNATISACEKSHDQETMLEASKQNEYAFGRPKPVG